MRLPALSAHGRGVLLWILVVAAIFAYATGALDRVWSHVLERPNGPMSFRFLLQPLMAALAAWKDGATDAATGRSPYFWNVLKYPRQRRAQLREGLWATGKILAIALAMDVTYQLIVFEWFYPVESLVIALLLAFVPYLLLRGLATRFYARRKR